MDDVCHYCHHTVTLHQPLALDPKKLRVWYEPCITKIRIRLLRRMKWQGRLTPLEILRKIDTFPYAA